MNATTVAVDLAKSVFQLAVADEHWRVVETQRLTRTQFERWLANRDVNLVIMEACGSAHHWGRWLNGLGIEVRLLPAQYVRAYPCTVQPIKGRYPQIRLDSAEVGSGAAAGLPTVGSSTPSATVPASSSSAQNSSASAAVAVMYVNS